MLQPQFTASGMGKCRHDPYNNQLDTRGSVGTELARLIGELRIIGAVLFLRRQLACLQVIFGMISSGRMPASRRRSAQRDSRPRMLLERASLSCPARRPSTCDASGKRRSDATRSVPPRQLATTFTDKLSSARREPVPQYCFKFWNERHIVKNAIASSAETRSISIQGLLGIDLIDWDGSPSVLI